MTRPRTQPRGYALLLVLAVLALSAVVGVGLARLAVARSAEANLAAEQLQLKWGWISATRAILPHAQEVLSPEGEDDRRTPRSTDEPNDPTSDRPLRAAGQQGNAGPMASRSASIRLGTLAFELTLADEQSKANPNLLLQAVGRPEAMTELARLLTGTVGSTRLRLGSTEMSPWPIGSYGQMFEDVTGEDLSAGRPGSAIRDRITPYGPGQVNVHTASREVLEAILAGRAGKAQVDAIIRVRQKDPDAGLSSLLASAGLTDAALEDAGFLLADRSTCHSLWGTIRSTRRSWTHLLVRSAGNEPSEDRWYAQQW